MKFGILGFNIFAPGGTTRSNLNLINEIKYDEDEIRYYNYLPFSKSDTIHFLVENNFNIEDLEFENYTSIEKDTDIDVYIITRESFFPIAKLIRSVSPNSKIIGEIHGPIDLLELNIKPHLKYFDALRVSTPSIKHRTMKEFNFDRIIDYPVSLRHLEFEEKVPEYTKNLLVHSRFTENPKDISYSIKLIEYLVNYLGRKDIHLYINGYGEGETLYRTLIKYYQLQDNVHINENVNEYIYISTSRYETLGYSIMEAISSNKKVLLFPGDDNVLGEIYQGFELVSWLDKNVANDAQTVLECIEQQIDKKDIKKDHKKISEISNIESYLNDFKIKVKPLLDHAKTINKELSQDEIAQIYYEISTGSVMLNNGFQSIINALKKNELIRKLSSIPSLYEYKEKARKALNDYALRKSMRYEASRVENSIFVESFHGKNFSGDPKYLAIAMKKEHPFLKVYVSSINQLVDTEILSYGFTPVRFGSKLYLEAANYADYIIVNGNTLDKVNINEQKVIQTWHGFPLKKMVNDLNDESKKEEELKMFLPRMKKWDYLLTSSDVNTKLLSSAFNVTENSKLRILEYGAPRNEYIIANKINDNEVGKIFWKYFNREYNADLKIILFCPTWRKGKRNSVSSLDLKRLIDGLPEDYHIIVKLHPLESHLRKNYSELDSRIHCFFNEVVDIQELYLLSSLLITDYSSTIFDYAHLKRSLLLIQDDEEEYSDAVGFYFDSEKITGIPKVKMSEDELCIEIINLIESKIVNHSIEISKYMEKDSEDTSKRIMRKIIKKYS